MKAIFYEQHGTAEVLQVGERSTPEPQDHEVLVEVVATSVNPIDRRLRSGELQEYITRTFPVVPGWDLAGRIVKVGAKVTDWQVGDEVLGLAFTWSGRVNIKNNKYQSDDSPLDQKCKNLNLNKYSKNYLNHLHNTNEMLSSMILTLNNINFYQELMYEIRKNIKMGTFDQFHDKYINIL